MNTPRLLVIGLLVATSARAQEAERPPITGIAYVRIYAKDPAASRRFYTEELLLPEAKCPVQACARYQVGKNQYVEVVNATESQPDGMQLIAFRTSDAEALRRYLAAHHVTVPPAVEKHQDGTAESP